MFNPQNLNRRLPEGPKSLLAPLIAQFVLKKLDVKFI